MRHSKLELATLAFILAGGEAVYQRSARADAPVKKMLDVTTEGYMCYEGPASTICAEPSVAEQQPKYDWKPSDCGSQYFKEQHEGKP
ncbi:MAG: hypothetical protein AABX37_01120, partial [Nanoarchaeota archaeon]